MAQTEFTTVQVNFNNSTVSSEGIISATGSASFGSNVISAGAAIQSWSVSFGSTDYNLQTVGASIANVTRNGTTVSFTASLQLEDKSHHLLYGPNAVMTVMVAAYCE